MNTTQEFKKKVSAALMDARSNFDGSDAMFAKQYGISSSVYSRLKNGELDRILSEAQWLNIGRRLDVTMQNRKWNIARTDVFDVIEEEVTFCKEHSKARIFFDDCGIGKSFAAKYLSRNMKNCFYVDASQSKSRADFIRKIASVLGVDSSGKISNVLASIKYYLTTLPEPIVILDEIGDIEYKAFLEIKALWNATENVCGWYMMGAKDNKDKMLKAMANKKVGYREIYSRFSESFGKITPVDKTDRQMFYKKLITQVLEANTDNKAIIPDIVKKCLVQVDGEIGGLRRAESLLILSNN